MLSKQVYKVSKFNQNALLKSYIDMNTEIRKNAKDDSFFLILAFFYFFLKKVKSIMFLLKKLIRLL